MNPRVSRSSALASKATGFPIAKIAAQARGRLPARRGHATTSPARRRRRSSRRSTTSSPRCRAGRSRSCPGASPVLGTQMQSVGEVMAIGRTFPESLQKALRSLETGRAGLNCDPAERELRRARRRRARAAAARCRRPSGSSWSRPRCGTVVSVERLHEVTGIDPWFLDQMLQIVEERDRLAATSARGDSTRADWRQAKRLGFGDAPARVPLGRRRSRRCAPRASRPACASPTRRSTPARPSSRRARRTTTAPTRTRTRSRRSTRPAVVILGSGPNRIGQGVEFDYCCVHAAFALSRRRLRDRDGQLQPRDRLHRLRHQRPPLLRAAHRRGRAATSATGLQDASTDGGGARGRGRRARRPDAAEARARARSRPGSRSSAPARRRSTWPRTASSFNASVRTARASRSRPAASRPPRTRPSRSRTSIGYPVLVRPSYVLGGRAMQIVYDDDDLAAAMGELAHDGLARPRRRAVGRAARR